MSGNGIAGWLRSEVSLELLPAASGFNLDDLLRLLFRLRLKLPKKLEGLSPDERELRDDMDARSFLLSLFGSFFAGPRFFL